MTFLEILPKLIAGDDVRRASWLKADNVFTLSYGIIVNNFTGAIGGPVSLCNLEGDDWEVYVETTPYCDVLPGQLFSLAAGKNCSFIMGLDGLAYDAVVAQRFPSNSTCTIHEMIK